MEPTKEYIVLSDKNNKIILITTDWYQCVRLAAQIRKCGGECTIFAATKG